MRKDLSTHRRPHDESHVMPTRGQTLGKRQSGVHVAGCVKHPEDYFCHRQTDEKATRLAVSITELPSKSSREISRGNLLSQQVENIIGRPNGWTSSDSCAFPSQH